MFLMFHLGRPDVLPVGDLGIRRAVEVAYGLRKLPDASASSGSPGRGARTARWPASTSGARSTTRRAELQQISAARSRPSSRCSRAARMSCLV